MVERGNRHALEGVLYWVYMHASLIKAQRQPLASRTKGPVSVLSVRICHLYSLIPVGSLAGLALADPALESPSTNPQTLLMYLLKFPSSHNSLAAGSQQPPAAPSHAAVQGGWLVTTHCARKKHQETFWAENDSLQKLEMEIP